MRTFEAVRFGRRGLTRMVGRLAGGPLERRRGAQDPRQVFAKTTERGLGRLAEATPPLLTGVRGLFLGRFKGEQAEQLAGIRERLLEAELAHYRTAG